MTEKWLICKLLQVKGPDHYQITFVLNIDLSNLSERRNHNGDLVYWRK